MRRCGSASGSAPRPLAWPPWGRQPCMRHERLPAGLTGALHATMQPEWAPQEGAAPCVPPDMVRITDGVLAADVREVFQRLLADEVGAVCCVSRARLVNSTPASWKLGA